MIKDSKIIRRGNVAIVNQNCASLSQFDHFGLFLNLLHLPGGFLGTWTVFGVMDILIGL